MMMMKSRTGETGSARAHLNYQNQLISIWGWQLSTSRSLEIRKLQKIDRQNQIVLKRQREEGFSSSDEFSPDKSSSDGVIGEEMVVEDSKGDNIRIYRWWVDVNDAWINLMGEQFVFK